MHNLFFFPIYYLYVKDIYYNNGSIHTKYKNMWGYFCNHIYTELLNLIQIIKSFNYVHTIICRQQEILYHTA